MLTLLTAVLVFVLLSLGLVDNDLADRYRWVCETKGALWIQPTHGEPYLRRRVGKPVRSGPTRTRATLVETSVAGALAQPSWLPVKRLDLQVPPRSTGSRPSCVHAPIGGIPLGIVLPSCY